MRKFSLVSSAIAALLLAAPASAADLPVKARPLPPPPPVFSWTGFYIGAHAGGAWGTTESTLNSITVDIRCLEPNGAEVQQVCEVPSPPISSVNGLNGNLLGTHTLSGLSIPISQTQTNGFLAGVQAGYNWQVAPWLVLGVEAQFSWTDLEGTSPCVVILACSTKHDWITTVAGRVGWTLDRLMLYLKGGVAWTKVDYSASLNLGSLFDGRANFTTSVSDTRVGAMFGAGVEYAFLGNWSAKLEYNYIRFRDQDYTFPLAFTFEPVHVNLSFDTTIKEHIHLVKAGLNYRFDWGKYPVVARY
jgi:outer membrane immunogenic protein